MKKTYAQHQTVLYLKKEAEKHKKSCENGEQKNSKCAYHPTKEKIHAIVAFAKDAMKNESFHVDKELANFEKISVSGNIKYEEWKIGPGPAENSECFMTNHNTNLAVKSNKFKFKSLDEYLNNLYTMSTYLKGQHNKNKRQRTDPTKLVPISFLG